MPERAGSLALASALLIVVALTACQSVDGDGQPVAGSATTAPTTAPTTAEPKAATAPSPDAYPSLSTVPRRPKLTYGVAQRRAIVEGLVADLENARYTDRVVRYRSGLSEMPPPPPPPGWRIAEAATTQAEALVPEPPATPSADQPQPAAAASDVTELPDDVDDSLDEFVTDLAESTAPPVATTDQAAAAAPDGADGTETPTPEPPWREPSTLVGWWRQWFGDDASDQPAEEVTGEQPTSATEGTAADQAAEPADQAEAAAGATVAPPANAEPTRAIAGDQPPSSAQAREHRDETITVLPADAVLGTPAKLVPAAFWPTEPPPPPSPRKPSALVIQPIPRPSVPIDVGGGRVTVPAPGAEVEASREQAPDDGRVLLVRAER